MMSGSLACVDVLNAPLKSGQSGDIFQTDDFRTNLAIEKPVVKTKYMK